MKNTGTGYATDVLISDLWKTIRAEKAGATLPVRAFDSWSATSVSVDGTDPTLTQPIAGSEVTGDNGYQIRYNIHPDHTVKLHVEGVVKADLVGDITNVVEVSDSSGSQTADATYVAATADLTVDKTVDKSQYESGDKLTYTIKIENTTANWASDVAIKDLVNDITSTSITGATVKAFESGTIFFNASSQTGDTKFPSSTGEF
ncbi:putative hemagglutinin/hemolysin-related protein [Vibrio sp. JCM 19052]|nr:putative hemagglutinin/hemolysin-related protein [Vibrio sp. JCM 19052]